MFRKKKTSVIPTAELLRGSYGKYLACFDDAVRVRVASYEDVDLDVFGECKSALSNWMMTAALVILSWEAAVEVVYAVSDPERDMAWHIARSTTGYTGLANDFYQDGDGWYVVVLRPLFTA